MTDFFFTVSWNGNRNSASASVPYLQTPNKTCLWQEHQVFIVFQKKETKSNYRRVKTFKKLESEGILLVCVNWQWYSSDWSAKVDNRKKLRYCAWRDCFYSDGSCGDLLLWLCCLFRRINNGKIPHNHVPNPRLDVKLIYTKSSEENKQYSHTSCLLVNSKKMLTAAKFGVRFVACQGCTNFTT